MHRLSRRAFVRFGVTGAAVAPFMLDRAAVAASGVTAQELVDRVKKALDVEWKAGTVDTFKAGDPSTIVTGVVTTSLATIDVMRRAVKAGANMVITSGPTFYSRADSPTPTAGRGRGATPPIANDPVFTAKNEFIRTNNLVVWRFSDHWRLRTPDPFVQGLTYTLGWAKYRANNDPRRVTVPAVVLTTLVADLKAKLNARGGMRIIGDPRARIQTVGLLPGTASIQDTLKLLPEVDAIIAGEIREWESSEYVRDAVHAGRNKALILIGRTLSEESGMSVCARWLETIVPDVRCRFISAGDPYWTPRT